MCLEIRPSQITDNLNMEGNTAADGAVEKEIHSYSSSKNKKAEFTATVQYSCTKDASQQDKREALEGLLQGLQTYIKDQFNRS